MTDEISVSEHIQNLREVARARIAEVERLQHEAASWQEVLKALGTAQEITREPQKAVREIEERRQKLDAEVSVLVRTKTEYERKLTGLKAEAHRLADLVAQRKAEEAAQTALIEKAKRIASLLSELKTGGNYVALSEKLNAELGG